MSTYFPFTPDYLAKRDVKRESLLQELNLAYCELISILLLALHGTGAANQTRSINSKAKNVPFLDTQIDRVGNYLVDCLLGEVRVVHFAEAAVSIQQSAVLGQTSRQPLTASTYSALLPTLWSLLNQSIAEPARVSSVPSQVLRALLEHTKRLPNNSSLKLPAVEFVGQIWLVGVALLLSSYCHTKH